MIRSWTHGCTVEKRSGLSVCGLALMFDSANQMVIHVVQTSLQQHFVCCDDFARVGL